jgi:hypothetical protein
METTRIERAIEELDTLDEFEPSCDDIRLAWLANELSAGSDFDAHWSER